MCAAFGRCTARAVRREPLRNFLFRVARLSHLVCNLSTALGNLVRPLLQRIAVRIVNENPAISDRVALKVVNMKIIHLVAVGLMLDCLDGQNPTVAEQQLVANVNVACVNPAAGSRGHLRDVRQVAPNRPVRKILAADNPEGVQEGRFDRLAGNRDLRRGSVVIAYVGLQDQPRAPAAS